MKHKISQLMAKRYAGRQFQLPDYNPGADFKWIEQQSGLPWLRLDLSVPTDIILQEISNIEHLLCSHRDSEYNEHMGWKSFCIHGKSYDATREDEYYNNTQPHVWTIESQRWMPKTVEYFSKVWPGSKFFRVRVMLLEPGGYVAMHADSTVSQLTAINIAITQPDGCQFIMERQGTVPFLSGTAFWLDLSNRHTVFNNSLEPRWHIIVHQEFDKNFQNIAVNSYKRLYNI